jgi:hypothetical protein
MKFLLSEKRDAVEIHSKIVQAFQEDGYTLSSVYEWIRVFKTGSINVLDDARVGRPRLDHIDSKILSVLKQMNFRVFGLLHKSWGLL